MQSRSSLANASKNSFGWVGGAEEQKRPSGNCEGLKNSGRAQSLVSRPEAVLAKEATGARGEPEAAVTVKRCIVFSERLPFLEESAVGFKLADSDRQTARR